MESKYNTGVPIDINSISEEERKIAFHEWAEGSKALEELLNAGYERGFLSHACCAGDTGKPYISYELKDENSKKMAMCIAKQLAASGLNCKISFTHDFYETEEEYRKTREHLIRNFPESFTEENFSPTRTITDLKVYAKEGNSEDVFKMMAGYIREAQLDSVKLPESEEEIPSRNFDEPIISKQDIIDKDIKSNEENILKVEVIEVITEISKSQKDFIQKQTPKQSNKEDELEI